MAVPVLVSLANNTHQQAVKAVSDAQHNLCQPLDQKVGEISDFRAQIASQEKKLRQLIASSQLQLYNMNKYKASDMQIEKSHSLQSEVEKLNRQIMVVEKAEELKIVHSQNR